MFAVGDTSDEDGYPVVRLVGPVGVVGGEDDDDDGDPEAGRRLMR